MGAAPKADVLHITDGAVNAGLAVTPCDQKLAGDATSDSGADVKTAVDWDARILNRSQGGDLVSAIMPGMWMPCVMGSSWSEDVRMT